MSSTILEIQSMSVPELITAAKLGDTDAYAEVVMRYQDRLYGVMRHYVGCPILAEDIVQDAFVRAYIHLGSFRQESEFYTWLYRIALNARRSYSEKQRRWVPIESATESDRRHGRQVEESPSAEIERSESCEQVRQAMKRLDESFREVLVLREFEGYDYQKIAEILEIRIGTVRSRLSRARSQLRRELSAYEQSIN
ncbi:ECF RNA polymerase sigma factor SigW [Rosistilla carotiformis]|uniref:RNA polymerase sigma factor n=2 Tax=Rosistilla carotiformis TaxID=2528017 RepID=A0A518JY16_9BACT|nr:ECF RNA polymerase sigma factor SigW [Rosistilla carotiformis]